MARLRFDIVAETVPALGGHCSIDALVTAVGVETNLSITVAIIFPKLTLIDVYAGVIGSFPLVALAALPSFKRHFIIIIKIIIGRDTGPPVFEQLVAIIALADIGIVRVLTDLRAQLVKFPT